jgi:hypothetical protein
MEEKSEGAPEAPPCLKTSKDIATGTITAEEVDKARLYVEKHKNFLQQIAERDGIAVIPKGNIRIRHTVEYYKNGSALMRHDPNIFYGSFKRLSRRIDIYTGEKLLKVKMLVYKDDRYKGGKYHHIPARIPKDIQKEIEFSRFGIKITDPIYYRKCDANLHLVSKVSFITEEMISFDKIITTLTGFEKKDIIIQIFEAVQKMHDEDCVHRDIKTLNILVKEIDGRKTPFLTDFGSATKVEDRSGYGTTFCTIPSEEFVSKTPKGSDMYTLGVLIYCIAKNLNFISYMQNLKSQFALPREKLMPIRPREFSLLALSYDLMAPEDLPRPTISEALIALRTIKL